MKIVFSGGPIHTGAEGADWVLVDSGRIAATGRGEAPDGERFVDLEGATLLPGFCDAHVHLSSTGLYALGLDLRDERSKEAILDRLRSHAQKPGAVLFGGNFEDTAESSMTRDDLDRTVGDRPALLGRADMHSCVVSSSVVEALDLEGVEGVDRDAAGRPTGYLREQAAGAAWRWFDASLAPDEQRAAIDAALDIALSKGVTSVHEMFVLEWRDWASLDVLLEHISARPQLIAVYVSSDDIEAISRRGLNRAGGDYFLDGSFGSHTAWMCEPFASRPPSGSAERGISYRSDEELLSFFTRAQEAGMQTGVHAIGDAAIEQAIAAWEKVAEQVGDTEVRRLSHRIEHFECAMDDHIARAAALGLCISAQPAFDAYWGGNRGLYAERIGRDRAALMNRFASMVRGGLLVGAGSDSTVTPLDPFLQMAALRDHHVTEERIGARKALSLHTLNSHALAGNDDIAGTIDVGKRADLTIVDRDPLEVDPDDLRKTEVISTWIAGQELWSRSEAAG
jgi:predicted amidohydrolase YtcJ